MCKDKKKIAAYVLLNSKSFTKHLVGNPGLIATKDHWATHLGISAGGHEDGDGGVEEDDKELDHLEAGEVLLPPQQLFPVNGLHFQLSMATVSRPYTVTKF
jgi:hypothetical protein